MSDVVVEIRDQSLALVRRQLADGVDRPMLAGQYFLRCYLPEGQVLTRGLRIEANQSIIVELPRELAEGDERFTASWAHRRPGRRLNVSADRDVRFYAFTSLDRVEPVQGPQVAVEDTRSELLTLVVSLPDDWTDRVVFARITPRGEVPVHVALPCGRGFPTCRLTLSGTVRGVSARASLADPRAELALRYLRHGLVREAAMVSERVAGVVDPVAAAAIELVHLRTREARPDGGGLADLLPQLGWLPDVAVLLAELDSHNEQYAVALLEALRLLGLPVLTGWLSAALHRLAELSVSPSTAVAERAESLYRSLLRWALFQEPDASTVSITCADLNDPAGSQVVPGWAQVR
jgi:hypothetical protein